MSFQSNIYSEKINKMKGKKELLESKLEDYKNNLSNTNDNIIVLEKAQAFIQQVAKDTQEQIKYQISDLVNLCLDTCFPDEYTFDVNFEIKRGKTEAGLVLLQHGIELDDPMNQCGGGVVDLASFALRIAAWSLGKSDNLIILDEPFKFLQPRELNVKGFEIIRKLSKELDLQFIINSNSVYGADVCTIANKIFEVSKNKVTGISNVMERSN